jgi:hypothetical protein
MLPTRSEWKAWSTRQRVEYVAQFAVPISLLVTVISLLVTVVFSYLSWIEARKSLELTNAGLRQQQALFIAQNPPDFDITGVHVRDSTVGPLLFFSLKNTGDSALRSPCVVITRVDKPNYVPEPVSSNCDRKDSYANATLRKGEGVTYDIPVNGYLRFRPQQWKILKPEDAAPFRCASKKGDSLLLQLKFKDVAGQEYSKMRQVILCD